MMTRAATPDVFPIRGLMATAMCVLALVVLTPGIPSLAGQPGSVSDLLRRAQSEADAHRFGQLLGAIGGQTFVSKSEHTDKAPRAETRGEMGIMQQDESKLASTPPAAPPPVAAASSPTEPIPQVVAPKSQVDELTYDALRVHVVAKKAVKTANAGPPRSRANRATEIRRRLRQIGVF